MEKKLVLMIDDEKYEAGNYSYSSREREAGSGKLRIGRSIKVRDDLYSMLFVSTLHAEYILHCEREHEEEEKAKVRLINDYNKERRLEKQL